MTPNIFSDRIATYKVPAWHSLGPTFQEVLTPLEAVKLAGMDYEVNKWPLSAVIKDKSVATPVFGLFRDPVKEDPNYVFYGAVSDDYQVVQNTEIAQIIEPISKLWNVSSVGALGKGETVFFVLDAGVADIKGDVIQQFFMVSDIKDGGHCLRVDNTDYRAVCGNTFRMAIANAKLTIALNHGRDPRKKLEVISTAIEKMQESKNVVLNLLKDLAEKKVTKAAMQKMVLDLYPIPDLSGLDPVTDPPEKVRGMLAWKERMEATQLALVELYNKFNDEFPQVAQTGYAFYNVVVELEDYKKGRNWERSALFGNRAHMKERAFDLVLAQK
jgi:phage/plasmid-like protein (TIGR03299 family)